MKNIKRVLLVIAILLIATVSFIVGGFVGYSKGTFYGLCASAPSDATMILTTIDRIKNHHVQSAIDLLESDLNSKMIEHRLLIKEGPTDNQTNFFYDDCQVSQYPRFESRTPTPASTPIT